MEHGILKYLLQPSRNESSISPSVNFLANPRTDSMIAISTYMTETFSLHVFSRMCFAMVSASSTLRAARMIVPPVVQELRRDKFHVYSTWMY
jgi:hypothetical protein